LEISPGSFQGFLKGNPNMGQMAAKFIPCLLREGQKEKHVNICKDIQERLKTDPYFF
jgi:hypothetical protein